MIIYIYTRLCIQTLDADNLCFAIVQLCVYKLKTTKLNYVDIRYMYTIATSIKSLCQPIS